jgi:hypothetical protein
VENTNIKQTLISEIEAYKGLLSDSYRILEKLESSKFEVEDIVIIKKSGKKGIIRSFNIDNRRVNGIMTRVFKLQVVTTNDNIWLDIDDIIPYTEASKLLYEKKVKVTSSNNEEIPF